MLCSSKKVMKLIFSIECKIMFSIFKDIGKTKFAIIETEMLKKEEDVI